MESQGPGCCVGCCGLNIGSCCSGLTRDSLVVFLRPKDTAGGIIFGDVGYGGGRGGGTESVYDMPMTTLVATRWKKYPRYVIKSWYS